MGEVVQTSVQNDPCPKFTYQLCLTGFKWIQVIRAIMNLDSLYSVVNLRAANAQPLALRKRPKGRLYFKIETALLTGAVDRQRCDNGFIMAENLSNARI